MAYIDIRRAWTDLRWLPAALGLGGVIGSLSGISTALPLAVVGSGTLTALLLLQPEVAILAILFIRPVVDLVPFGLSVPGFAKEFGIAETVALLLVLVGGIVILAQRIDPFRIPAVLPFIALLSVGIASFASSENPQVTTIALLRLAGQLSLYVLVYSYLQKREQLDRLLTAIVLSALPPLLWGFNQMLAVHGRLAPHHLKEGITNARLEGPFGGGLTVGIFLIIPIVLALVSAIESRGSIKKLGFAGFATFMLVALYFTLARTAWLAIGVVVAVLATVRYRKLRLLAPVALVILVLAVAGIRQRWEPVFTNTEETTAAGRVERWEGAVEVFRSNLVLGAGLGVGDVKAGEAATGRATPTHGDYFRVLADTGVLGLTAFLWLLAATGWAGLRAYRAARDPYYKAIALSFCSVWVAFVVMRTTSNVLTHQVFQYYYWALAGATFAIANLEGRPEKGTGRGVRP